MLLDLVFTCTPNQPGPLHSKGWFLAAEQAEVLDAGTRGGDAYKQIYYLPEGTFALSPDLYFLTQRLYSPHIT